MLIPITREIEGQVLGVVAEGCQACDAVRPHELLRQSRVSRVCFVKLGRGRNLELSARCLVCEEARPADLRDYAAILKSTEAMGLSIDRLTEITNPSSLDGLDRRRGLYDRLRDGSLLRDDRVDLVVEALRRAESWAGPRIRAVHFDRTSGILLIVTVLLAISAGVSANIKGVAWSDKLAAVCAIGALLAGLATLLALITDVPRYMRRTGVTKNLAADLLLIRANAEELRAANERAKRMGLGVASHVNWMRLATEHSDTGLAGSDLKVQSGTVWMLREETRIESIRQRQVRIEEGRSSPEDRVDRIVTAVVQLNQKVFARVVQPRLDNTCWKMIGVVTVGAMGLAMAEGLPKYVRIAVQVAFAIAIAASMCGLVWALLTSARRYLIAAGHHDRLVDALRMVMPAREEIDIAVERLKQMKVVCVRHIDWKRVGDELWTVEGEDVT